MEDDRIWLLFARRVSREITPEEVKELEALVGEHPEHVYAMDIIQRFFESGPPVDSPLAYGPPLASTLRWRPD